MKCWLCRSLWLGLLVALGLTLWLQDSPTEQASSSVPMQEAEPATTQKAPAAPPPAALPPSRHPTPQSAQVHPRWPKATVLEHRAHPVGKGEYVRHEWLLDAGRADTPIRVVEKLPSDETATEERPVYLEMAANRVLVTLADGADPARLAGLIRGARVLPVAEDVIHVQLDDYDLDTVPRLMAALRPAASVFNVEPDYIVRHLRVPNDPEFSRQWAFRNTGQTGGRSDADIDATEAWDLQFSAANIVVAVIDSGVRTSHQDLRDNLWSNPQETRDGRDSDGNGVIDDINGYNAIAESGDVRDNIGHGTHVAGIIGASGNNGLGGTGVAWDVQIMAVKFMDEGFGTTGDAIKAIDYARENGADIINASWGGPGESTSLGQAILRARNAGIPFVAAAGNESSNNDVAPSFPANYNIDNVVSVGSSNALDRPSSFSNYGATSVDFFAPGEAIFSTWHTGDAAYNTISGTSMAAPKVSGMLALLAARFPGEGYNAWVQRLLATVDRPQAMAGLSLTGGRTNLNNALRAANADLPPVITRPLQSKRAEVGASVTFSVDAAGTAPLSYTWLHKGERLNTAEGSSLTLSNLAIVDSGTVQVRVRNDSGVATSSADLIVSDDFVSLAEAFDAPKRSFASSGDAAWETQFTQVTTGTEALVSGRIGNNELSRLETTVIGPGVLSFWWRVSSERDFDFLDLYIDGILYDFISGETGWSRVSIAFGTGTYDLSWLYTKDGSVSVGDDAGYLDGFKFLNESELLPKITLQPVSQVITPSGDVAFEVAAEDLTGNLSYRWLKNGRALEGSSRVLGVMGKKMQILVANPSDAGLYTVRVTNENGSVLSSAAQLTVSEGLPVRILQHPEGATVGVGAELTLAVSVDGSAPFEYIWFKNGKRLPGEASHTLVLDNLGIEDGGDYHVRVSNNSGAVESEIAEILVIEASIQPVFLKHPSSAILQLGDDFSLTIEVGGAEPLAIEWLKDGKILSGENGTTLELESLTFEDAGVYQARIRNDFGTVSSRNARLRVLSPASATVFAVNGEEQSITLEGRGARWETQSEIVDSNSIALRSAPINALEESVLSSYVVGPGLVFFRWKVSSEANRDFLKFSINGELQYEISGEIDWETRSYELPEGEHLLEWVYAKSATGEDGADAGFLDQIFLTDGARALGALDYFENTAAASNGWIFARALGFIYGDNFRWAYHEFHGWWYLTGSGGASGFWAYDLAMGWIYILERSYPAVYSADLRQWLVYELGTTNPRVFNNSGTGQKLEF